MQQAVQRLRVLKKERPLVAGSGGVVSIQSDSLAGPPPWCLSPGHVFFVVHDEEQIMCL